MRYILENKDLFIIILSYVKDYHSFYLLNTYYKSLLPKHKCISYKDIYSCSIYKNSNKYKAIKILKKNIHKNSIHFKNKTQFQIVSKYIYKKGHINHYCCNGKGCLFINNDYITNRFY